MKTESGAVGIFAADAAIGANSEAARNSFALPGRLTGHATQAPALLLSLLFHALLLLVCVAGWRLRGVADLPPRTIAVFAVEEAPPGQAEDGWAQDRAATAPVPRGSRAEVQEIKSSARLETRSRNVETQHPASAADPAPLTTGPAQGSEAFAAIDVASAGHAGPIAHGRPESGEAPGQGGQPQGEVMARPLYQLNPPPPYPRLARRLGQEGVVLLEVAVSVSGQVDEVRIQTGSGHEVLDEAALEAVRAWRFSAGRRNGEPVAMRVQVPVRFNLHGRSE
ncbi:MAG: energy transducer TonB [Thermodesulfobacteriota bacterium]